MLTQRSTSERAVRCRARLSRGIWSNATNPDSRNIIPRLLIAESQKLHFTLNHYIIPIPLNPYRISSLVA